MTGASNQKIVDKLRELAALLEQQGANRFRVGAYRRAAETVAVHVEDLTEVLARDGLEGLIALPGIGRSIASAIRELVHTGRWVQLERLRGTLEPEQVFRSVPGIGPVLAHSIHDALHIETLEALEIAAHDGRLERVPGVGPRRAAMLRAALGSMLGRRPLGRSLRQVEAAPAPEVALLLEVDAEYRREATADRLRKIAPRRFNPSGGAWLPVLHSRYGAWDFTALFSNTARAHELGRVRDWVVIYYHTDTQPEGQCTVVTETRGPIEGRRVVRGREVECRAHYAGRAPPAETRKTA
ncbi:MAG: helix-hairpin-helix domain-containing protein [Alphaproteobacteria bacterium]